MIASAFEIARIDAQAAALRSKAAAEAEAAAARQAAEQAQREAEDEAVRRDIARLVPADLDQQVNAGRISPAEDRRREAEALHAAQDAADRVTAAKAALAAMPERAEAGGIPTAEEFAAANRAVVEAQQYAEFTLSVWKRRQAVTARTVVAEQSRASSMVANAYGPVVEEGLRLRLEAVQEYVRTMRSWHALRDVAVKQRGPDADALAAAERKYRHANRLLTTAKEHGAHVAGGIPTQWPIAEHEERQRVYAARNGMA
ncbi:hypothetical protein [Paracraurococcus lichenis]|uniref:Uncharacterized protein n=1 Tax=Paracraurococcus lichenis TaxID=3064888 RepID=A0ABT9E8J4_9PROT|nr:hypothetical protein [Paracraurococcus sp. LOR1-02]MDO9712385.1 hypothetical protein [Paracraurococcus sp. LOR1-02]